MVRLTATNLPAPAPPYLLEVSDIAGDISWNRMNETRPVLVRISLEGLPRKDIKALDDAFSKLGSYRRISLKLVSLESSDKVLTFDGFIKNLEPNVGSRAVILEIEE